MPQQLGSRPGQSESAPHRMMPGDSKQAAGASHVVDRLVVDTQHTLPGSQDAVLAQLNDVPMSQVSPTAMHIAVGRPLTGRTQQVCMPAKHVSAPQGI